ncbi:ABC transporter substrate-binding protein (plasmid) [Alloyangia pacifica]|uniref:ABC transporter substrate-binding protein n=1 Tax=Alloyangia pacifica TaxID=311180 RepID=A0A2U8HPC1_9RHOB|nr:ABC transporter substrate-binding protein [Alloyangia pacifica]AWI86665.1 ABC transporter substrate-binding protein [Alloyangia pacifica]
MKTLTRRATLAAIGGALATPYLVRSARAGTSVNVGALRFVSHAPSFIALERGYFQEAGLDVSFDFFEAAQPMAVAIASGDTDYAMTAISGGLISLADKGVAKVIGGALTEEKGIPGQKILASNAAYEAGLTSPADLDGKTFGMTQAGSSFHYMGARIAAAENAQLKFKPLQKTGAVIGAIKSGQIDAWSIVPHIAKPLADAGAVKIIGEVADYIPDYQVTTVFTSAKIASEEGDQTRAFLAALSRGADDFNAALVDKTASEDEQEAIVALLAAHVYPDRALEDARAPIVDGAMRINAGMSLNRASIVDQLEWFKAENLVKADIAYETLVDESYVEARS